MIRTVLIATALASCVQADQPELGSTEQEAKCPVTGCGNNSPLLGPFKADELEEHGVANKAGLQLLGYVGRPVGSPCTAATPCRVDVRDDDLIVIIPSTTAPSGFVERTGTALTGGHLLVWQPGEPNAVPPILPGNAKIHINTWSKVTTFWQGSNGPIVDTYELFYEIPGHSRGPVCGSPPPAIDGEGNQWQSRMEAMFYTGDRYDHDTMTVTATTYAESGNWFNIACAGSATMKLHLNRHTTAGSTTGFATTKSQRQTMLKMFSGDFCGDGTTYTVHGTRIEWRTNNGLTGYIGPGINSFESYWNEDGAVCLTRHRLASSPDQELAGMESLIKNGHLQTPQTCRRLSACSSWTPPRQYYLRTSSAALP